MLFSLLRLIGLWWSACRLRLDDLLPAKRPWILRLIFLPALLIPRPKFSAAARLRIFFESQGPIFVKFGQLLSTRPDLFDPEIAGELQFLQDRVPPFDPKIFRQIVERSLGGPVTELFGSFEEQPLASASLAQVHGATLKDGREVVIKVLRPRIEPQVQRDLRLLESLAWIVDHAGELGRRLHAPEVIADYRHTIENELNLQYEAANAQKIRDNFRDRPINYTPEVIWDYVRQNVLVSERINGIPVTDRKAILAQGTDLQKLAEVGVEIFFTQVFEHNFFHADMHPGNIFVSREDPANPQYISIDCAIVGSLTDSERRSLSAMLLGVFRRDYRRVAEVQIESGWVSPDTPVHKFEAEIRTVCEPIFAKPLSEISFAGMLVSLFRTARRFDMQVIPSLVLLEKTIINIEGLGRQLYPELDLWATAKPFLEKWSRQHYSIRRLVKDFRKHMPEHMDEAAELLPMIRQAIVRLAEEPPPPKREYPAVRTAGATLIGLGAGLGLAQWGLLFNLHWLVPGALGLAGLVLLVRSGRPLR